MHPSITRIETDEELFEIGRLRYEVQVSEMGLAMKYADHHQKTVLEPLDKTGRIFAAWLNGQIIGSVRLNLLKESDVGHYFEDYGIGDLPTTDYAKVSITTRLVVRNGNRNANTSLLLPMYAYHLYLDEGILYDVVDCRPPLASFFQKLGYRPHIESWGHPEFGDVIVQRLHLRDEQHLATVRSPFLKLLKAVQELEKKNGIQRM